MRKIPNLKSFLDNRGGITFLHRKKFCRKSFWGTLQFPWKVGFRKILCIRRGYHDVPCEVFHFSARTFSKETLPLWEKSRTWNLFWIIEGGSHFCIEKNFAENLSGEPFSFHEKSGFEKFYALEGVITMFRVKFFISVPEHLVRKHFGYEKNPELEIFFG